MAPKVQLFTEADTGDAALKVLQIQKTTINH